MRERVKQEWRKEVGLDEYSHDDRTGKSIDQRAVWDGEKLTYQYRLSETFGRKRWVPTREVHSMSTGDVFTEGHYMVHSWTEWGEWLDRSMMACGLAYAKGAE